MIVSEHAKKEMQRSGIDEAEVKACLEYGELVIRQVVRGEIRYGKQLDLKDKTIMVIYARKDDEARVVTAYIIKRKKWQKTS